MFEIRKHQNYSEMKFSNFNKAFSLLLCLSVLSNPVEGVISGNMSVSDSTINALTAYSFIIDTTTIIPLGGYLTLTFPSQVTLSSSVSCSFQFGFSSSLTPACTVASTNVLKISNGFPNLNGIRFKVSTARNPGSAQTVQGFVFRFYSTSTSTTATDTSSTSAFFQLYKTDTLSDANISPGSYVVGETSDWTISVTPKNPIPVGGIVKFYMPKWNIPSLYSTGAQSMLSSGTQTCSAVSGISPTSMDCTFSIDSIATNKDILTITGAFTSIQAAGSLFEITVTGVRNMPTTRPYTDWQIFTYDASGYGIDSKSDFEVAMNTAATLPSDQVKIQVDSPTSVDAITTYLFTLFIGNPVPMGGNIRIRIPSQVGPNSLTTCVAEQRISSDCTVAPVSSDAYYVQLSNGYPTVYDSVPVAGLIAFRLQYLQNPSTSSTSSSFEITTYDDTYEIETITTGLTVIGTTGAITMNSFTYSESRVLEYNTFNYDLTIANPLQVGCTIELTFPSEFLISDVSSTTCKLISPSGLSSSYTCTITSNKLIISTPFGSVNGVGGERIKFTVANNYIQNPTSSKPTSTKFSARTVSSAGSTIDSWTGATFTATYNELSSASVTPGSYIAGATGVTYSFTLRTPRQVEQNAYVMVSFPSSEVYITDTSAASSKCTSIQTMLTSISCSAKTSSVTVTKGFTGSICTCSSDIKFSVGSFQNPRSLQPTSTFTISVYSSDNYLIYQKKTGIQVSMLYPETSSSMTVTQSIGANGGQDNYKFTVKSANELDEGDYMILYAPNEIKLSSSTTCSGSTGVRGFYKCKFTSPNIMTISFMFSGRRMLGSVSPSSTFSFSLLNITNSASMSPSSQFLFELYTMDDYLIGNITSGPTVSNTKPSSMTSLFIKPSVYSDGQWTNLTFTVTPKNYMQYMSMTIQIPSDVLITSASPSLCQVISTYTLSKDMTCDYFSSTRTLRLINAFQSLSKVDFDQASPTLKQVQFMLGQFINPVGVSASGNFTVSTFDKSGFTIDSIKAPIMYVCTPPCKTCSADDYTKCTSCNTSSAFGLLYMGQCVATCPASTTQIVGKCITCSSQCSECSSTNDTCINCKKGFLYVDGECMLTCPPGYTFEAPSSCTVEIVPVYSFTSYFQKTDNYQCYLFPFSGGSILIALVMWICSCLSRRFIEFERRKVREQNREVSEDLLTPIRIIEVCIALISLIEVGGWIFFLYCMINVDEKLPFYVICGACGFNFFLNFIMTCGIMKSKENYDDYLNRYSHRYSFTYSFIKFFTLLISHKGFYFSFARYQRERGRHSHFDFSYFDSGDEDGISGLCFKFFFLTSILLLHGAVIAACVLNYLQNDLTKQLFCLDLDIIGMTTFQAFLVLITLIQCGGDRYGAQRIYPQEDDYSARKDDAEKKGEVKGKSKRLKSEELDSEHPSADDDEDGIKPSTQAERQPGKKSNRRGLGKDDQNSQMGILEEDEDEEGDDMPPLSQRQSTTRKNSKQIPQSSQRKGRKTPLDQKPEFIEEEDDFEEEKLEGKKRRQKRLDDPTFDDQDEDEDYKPTGTTLGGKKPPKNKLFEKAGRTIDPDENEEEGNAFDTIDPKKKPKQKQKRLDGKDSEFERESDEAEDISPAKKPRKEKKKKVKKPGVPTDQTSSESSDSEEEQDNKGQKKPKKKKRKPKVKNDKGQTVEDSETLDEDEDSSDEVTVKKKQKKKKPKVKNAKGETLEDSETLSEEKEEEEEDAPKQKKRPKQRKPKVKNARGETVEDSVTIQESDIDEQPQKKKKDKKFKQKQQRDDSEESQEEIEVTETDPKTGKKQKVKKLQPKRVRKQSSEEEISSDDLQQEGDRSKKKKSKKNKKPKKHDKVKQSSSSSSEEEVVDEEGVPQKRKKHKKKKPVIPTFHRVSHSASSLEDAEEFGEQAEPGFMGKAVPQGAKATDNKFAQAIQQQLNKPQPQITEETEPDIQQLANQMNNIRKEEEDKPALEETSEQKMIRELEEASQMPQMEAIDSRSSLPVDVKVAERTNDQKRQSTLQDEKKSEVTRQPSIEQQIEQKASIPLVTPRELLDKMNPPLEQVPQPIVSKPAEKPEETYERPWQLSKSEINAFINQKVPPQEPPKAPSEIPLSKKGSVISEVKNSSQVPSKQQSLKDQKSVKAPTDIQPSSELKSEVKPITKQSTVKEEQKLPDIVPKMPQKMSAEYEILNNSIPTQQEEEYLERGNNAKFGTIKQSLPTQIDGKNTNQDEDRRLPSRGNMFEKPQEPQFDSQSKDKSIVASIKTAKEQQPLEVMQKEQSALSQVNPKKNSNMNGEKDDDAEKLSNFIQNLPQRSHYQPSNPSERYATPEKNEEMMRSQTPNQEPVKVAKQASLGQSSKKRVPHPEEAKHEMKQPEEEKKELPAARKQTPPPKPRVRQILEDSQPSRRDSEEVDNDEDEQRDQVNKDDIKPKTVILFSDKSESSVEEMMEDTPSNYNVMNGRLDEESQGLRSLMYKALNKKILYNQIAGKLNTALHAGKEDKEARTISSRGASDKRSVSQGRPPSSNVDHEQKTQKIQDAKMFIQKAEVSGTGLLSGLLKGQFNNTGPQRNAHISSTTSGNKL